MYGLARVGSGSRLAPLFLGHLWPNLKLFPNLCEWFSDFNRPLLPLLPLLLLPPLLRLVLLLLLLLFLLLFLLLLLLYGRRTAPLGIPVFLYSLCFSSLYCRRTAPLGIPVYVRFGFSETG